MAGLGRAGSVAAIVLVLTAAQPATSGERYVDPIFGGVTKSADLVYGEAVNVDGELQELALDLYEPAGDDEVFRPVYVWAHGGSFIYGSKSSAGPSVAYAKTGWVSASVSYRLRPDMAQGFRGVLTSSNPVAAADERLAAARDGQHDMQAAVRWVRRNAAKYRLDASRIVAAGFSAGAEAALMVAFNADDPGDSGNPGHPSDVAAGVSHAGIFFPVTHGVIGIGEPPVAMLHGTNDSQVPFPAILPSCAMTIALLNVCELTSYPGEDHGVFGTDVALDFLRRHVVDADRQATSIEYTGPTHARGEKIEAAALLRGPDGAALAGREIAFVVGDHLVIATTDADGRAEASLQVPDHGRSQVIDARYHGEPGIAPSMATASVSWGS